MLLEEYKKLMEDEDWAPGWDAIDEAIEEKYPSQKPSHYGTDFHARAMFGGNEYLDGYSIYKSDKGYYHIITYGMSELYANEEAFNGEWSGWGYEMTFKLKAETEEECMWAISMLSNLARYTYTKKRYFEHLDFIPGNGTSLHIGVESDITALIVIHDTELSGRDTIHGKLDFMQMVGITERELEVIKEDRENIKVLVENIKKDNEDFVTDMSRKKSYL